MYVPFGVTHNVHVHVYRTMSNWVLEFDRWAPSVVKIAYKVRQPCSQGLYTCTCTYMHIHVHVLYVYIYKYKDTHALIIVNIPVHVHVHV